MKITIVKKVREDGSLCPKSAEVWSELQEAKLLSHIDRIVFAHESKPQGKGMVLAIRYQVSKAPFFIVEQEDKSRQVYTDYPQFLQEVLNISQ